MGMDGARLQKMTRGCCFENNVSHTGDRVGRYQLHACSWVDMYIMKSRPCGACILRIPGISYTRE